MKEVHNIYESSMKEVHNIYESSVKEVHNIYEETKVPTRTLNNNNNNNLQTYTTVRDSLTVKKSAKKYSVVWSLLTTCPFP